MLLLKRADSSVNCKSGPRRSDNPLVRDEFFRSQMNLFDSAEDNLLPDLTLVKFFSCSAAQP
jgi:hypothetical protein